MGVPTYQPIANITLGSATASVTFSGITQQYRDLILVWNGKMVSSGDAVRVFLNGDTASNYSSVWMQGSGSTTNSGSESTGGFRVGGAAVGLTTTGSDTILFNLMDYSATDKHKTAITRYSGSDTEVVALAGRWANTATVTTVRISGVVGNFAAGTSVALYGVLA